MKINCEKFWDQHKNYDAKVNAASKQILRGGVLIFNEVIIKKIITE